MNEESASPEAIAVIGIAGRFPEASSPDEFWNNLISGKDCIQHFPAGEGKVGARSVIKDPDLFDAAFFNIYPKEAELMDPQHRVFLECAWEALEDAAVDPATYPGMIGVYAGLSLNTYLLNNLRTGGSLAENYQVSEYQTMLGNDKDFLPVRVSYKLNLRGPSMTIQSACSTSLVAISQAATALMTYQCDMALAGGVSITFPQHRGYDYQEDGMVSPDGTCRTFDAEAKGTVFGHGCGAVLLKRLSEALADGDPIHAVIRGWAVNNDGSDKVGFAAPGVNAQADVIMMAQAAAGVHPDEISYIEAHGTGTPLGDPIEIAGLTKAFREGGSNKNGSCVIGSGKTHIGHLDCAAGVTGLIKTILQFRHEKIPGLLHFSEPNPHIDFSNSPFTPAAKETDWPRGEIPRIAGVSAFGVGGTNAHVIIEEPPISPKAEGTTSPFLLPLSARSPEALAAMASRLADFLETAKPDLTAVAHTLATGRRAFAHRTAFVASTTEEAVTALHSTLHFAKAGQHRVVFLFPGQGAQATDMARGLYDSHAVFRSHIDECARGLQPFLHLDIRRVLFPADGETHDINRTALAQPCIFAVEYALAKLWMHHGVQPALLIGHSVGEFVAAVIAGTFKLEDALGLIARRGGLMQDLPSGSMLAVRANCGDLDLPDGIELAASNAPGSLTLTGPTEKIEAFHRQLEARKVQSKILTVSHAFHSAMMESIMESFAADVAMVPAAAPSIPWFSTSTATRVTGEMVSDAGYWSRQLRQPVLFQEAIAAALSEDDLLFLEVGPGQALANFTRRNPAKGRAPVIATLPGSADTVTEFLAASGELWKHGVMEKPATLHETTGLRRIHLPSYPFERKSYWIDRSAETPAAPVNQPIPPLRNISTPTPTPPIIMQSGHRLENLSSQLRSMILELSGVTVTDDTATFTELGFDSLFLTQASQGVLSRWGAKVTFRQMLGELSSVAALAKHLDSTLPESAPVAPPAPVATTAQQAAPAGDLQALLANNLQIIQAMMAGQTAAPAPLPLAGPSPVRWPDGRERASQTTSRFGPFKPIESGEKGGLTKTQENFLTDLVSRYTAKTAKSKTYTTDHRPHFADPRAVSGFKSQWKEMVYPIVSASSKGSQITDIDGNSYVDITMGFGTYFFGHSPDWLTSSIGDQLKTGIEIGPQSAIAGGLAKDICELTGMERATFCNTGSEAVMAAMRLARCVTGRDRIVYFTGDYHGMFEEVLVRGSWINGVYKPQPIAPGIPQSLVENMLVLDYADPASLEILRNHAHEIAAVLVEPVQSRAPDVQPRQFMHDVRDITRASGTALIFDEVVTGFRCAPGGAQEYFGIEADMATYGKVIGGGMPIGVLAGKREYMDALDGGAWNYGDDSIPEVGVTFFAGTFVRHPLAMAAARRVVDFLKEQGPALQIGVEERVSRFCSTLNDWLEKSGVPIRLPHFSAVVALDYAHELKHASLLWYALREKGIHVWEGRPIYFTTAHTDEDFDAIIRAFVSSVKELQAAGFLPAATADVEAPEGFPRYDSAPTTEAQKEIFHATFMGDDANCAFNESNVIRFEGALDSTALKAALLDIVTRHPALRSTFSEDGSVQYFDPAPGSVEWMEHDLTAFDPATPASTLPASLVRSSESSAPFDLVNGPLYRFQLIKLTPALTELVFTAHHIVCDGWSFGMILAELATCYNARKSGKLPKLPPAMPFAKYARMEQATDSTEAENYWVAQYADSAPVLDLPVDRPRPAVREYHGAMEHMTLPAVTYAAIRKASPALGGTLFATLLSSFAAFLHCVTGQEDLVIGVPAAGQTRVGCDELIGHCLNFLPLRLRPQAGETFAAFSKTTRDLVLEAYDHQDFTFGSLLRKIEIPRDTSRVPLVSAIFNIDKNGTEHIRFDGLAFDTATNPKQFVNFDLFFNLVQTEEKLIVECEYNTGIHDAATIRTWLARFADIIAQAAENGSVKLADLAPVSSETTAEALPPAAENTIQEFFEKQAALQPNAPAIKAHDRTVSYRQLDRAANALARKLRNAGVNRESLVVVCSDRSPETITAILAVLKAGGAYVPVDPKYPTERIAHIIADTAAPVTLTRSDLVSTLPAANTKVITIDDALTHQADALESVSGPEVLAYVIYTSGSTGVPKGVAIEHRNAIAFIAWAKTVWTPEEMSGVLFSTSICFDLSVYEMFVTLAMGGAMILAENALMIGGHPHKEAITLINTVPSAISELADADLIPASTRVINLAGEFLAEKLVDKLHAARAGVTVYDLYGPSEDTTYSTYTRRDAGKPASIGKPIAGTTAHVVDEHGNTVPPGTPGELLLGGAGLARGYLNRPELTAEKFISHGTFGRLYRTGDRVSIMPDGNLRYLGRLDHQVKLRGFRIELGEIESALESHPAVDKAVVTVADDKLAAYITTQAAPASADDGTTIWRDQWDMLYSSAIEQGGAKSLDRMDSVIAGWSGLGNLDNQVDEWISTTVERIRELDGKHVYEIGCGTGQLLSRLAPEMETYWASDISQVAIDALAKENQSPGVRLFARPADDFTGIPEGRFDLVIINSVAQYFPSAEYLSSVLLSAAKVVKPGGKIFLGDVQSHALLAAHHATALRTHVPAGTTCGEFRATLARRLAGETELSLDPEWFDRISLSQPDLSLIETPLRRGAITNETTTYHYDVILHVGAKPSTRIVPFPTAWGTMNLEQLEATLSRAPSARHITDIPDSRLAASLAFLRRLTNADDSATLPDLGNAPANAVSAEDLHLVATRTGHCAHVRWHGDGTRGAMEVIFLPHTETLPPEWSRNTTQRPLSELANSPAGPAKQEETLREIRAHISRTLPEYMVPAAITALDAFPLTPNGKIDRKALPSPVFQASEETKPSAPPTNETETKLVEIWKTVLKRESVGIHDDIFALGGDSILIFQISTRANREGIRITPAQVFRLRKISALAAEKPADTATSPAPAIQRVNRDAYRRTL